MALSRVRALLACLLALAGSGCMTLAHKPDLEAGLIAMQARDTTVDCTRADACAAPSPLRELGGRADECPVYELYAYLLAADDDEFATGLGQYAHTGTHETAGVS